MPQTAVFVRQHRSVSFVLPSLSATVDEDFGESRRQHRLSLPEISLPSAASLPVHDGAGGSMPLTVADLEVERNLSPRSKYLREKEEREARAHEREQELEVRSYCVYETPFSPLGGGGRHSR